MFWLRNKKIKFSLHTLNLSPDIIILYIFLYNESNHMCLRVRKPDFVVYKLQRHRPACVYVQSDQWLCYSHFRKVLCLPPSGSGDILFFPGRLSVCLSQIVSAL